MYRKGLFFVFSFLFLVAFGTGGAKAQGCLNPSNPGSSTPHFFSGNLNNPTQNPSCVNPSGSGSSLSFGLPGGVTLNTSGVNNWQWQLSSMGGSCSSVTTPGLGTNTNPGQLSFSYQSSGCVQQNACMNLPTWGPSSVEFFFSPINNYTQWSGGISGYTGDLSNVSPAPGTNLSPGSVTYSFVNQGVSQSVCLNLPPVPSPTSVPPPTSTPIPPTSTPTPISPTSTISPSSTPTVPPGTPTPTPVSGSSWWQAGGAGIMSVGNISSNVPAGKNLVTGPAGVVASKNNILTASGGLSASNWKLQGTNSIADTFLSKFNFDTVRSRVRTYTRAKDATNQVSGNLGNCFWANTGVLTESGAQGSCPVLGTSTSYRIPSASWRIGTYLLNFIKGFLKI